MIKRKIVWFAYFLRSLDIALIQSRMASDLVMRLFYFDYKLGVKKMYFQEAYF